MKVQPMYSLPASQAPSITLWQRALIFLHLHPKLGTTLAGLTLATLSLAVWVTALFLENKILKNQIAQQQLVITQKETGELKGRITEAQQQMSQLKTQMEQQTGEALDSREALATENAKLVQELTNYSKPQLGAPVVTLESASQKQAQATPTKKDLATVIDVPYNLAIFSVVLQQAEDKGYQSYFVELTDQKGKDIVWSEQLKKAVGPNIPLAFTKRSYAPGKYQIKLYGMNGKKKEFLDRYDIQVNYLPEPVKGKVKKK
jgi:hypothetical protein